MTINYHYWEYNCKHYHVRQTEKEILESHSQKQEKASISSPIIASQNKASPSLIALSVKTFSLKSSPSPAPKKQPNSLWVDLSSKLASNSKLTSDKCKKHLKNNLYFYCGARDHKLDSCSKQTMVTSKDHNASATTDSLAVASKNSLEK